ncbi:MAG: hypothetical protein FJ247_07005 [Nitrospira sp.]|nr:hypothetical protein [Nitrospira sp.]
MPQDALKGLAAVRLQIEKLDKLAEQTNKDLNTVAGMERVEHWKTDTVAILTHTVGLQEAQKFAGVHPEPCFTNDLIEEFADLIECYRTPLVALAKQLSHVTP